MKAAAARWAELHPDVRVEWAFRSLAAFNDEPLDGLASRFDLLVIDHPFMGAAAAARCLAPLDELLSGAELDAHAADSAGQSHASYAYAGHQWALAVDAACQVAAAREDLLESAGHRAPASWDAVEALADALPGRVAIPLYPTDAICTLLTMCASLGAPAGEGQSFFPDPAAGERALATLARLLPRLHPRSLGLSPPAVFGLMRDTDGVAYVPAAFGYSGYARTDTGGRAVAYANVPTFGERPARSVLGGAGMAVSARCEAPAAAGAFASWVSGAEAQREVVVPAGGQPGSRAAWSRAALDPEAGRFFAGTRAAIEAAWVRPRDAWWPPFQEAAGELVHDFLRTGAEPAACLRRLEQVFAEHRGETESDDRL